MAAQLLKSTGRPNSINSLLAPAAARARNGGSLGARRIGSRSLKPARSHHTAQCPSAGQASRSPAPSASPSASLLAPLRQGMSWHWGRGLTHGHSWPPPVPPAAAGPSACPLDVHRRDVWFCQVFGCGQPFLWDGHFFRSAYFS